MVAGGLCDKHATLLSDDSASALRNSIADSIEKAPSRNSVSVDTLARWTLKVTGRGGWEGPRVSTWQHVSSSADLGTRSPAHQEARRDKGLTSSPGLSHCLSLPAESPRVPSPTLQGDGHLEKACRNRLRFQVSGSQWG